MIGKLFNFVCVKLFWPEKQLIFQSIKDADLLIVLRFVFYFFIWF